MHEVRGLVTHKAVPRQATACRQLRRPVRFSNHRRLGFTTAASPPDGGGTADDPWNKGPIDLDANLYGYLLKHTREPDVLRELRVETATLRGSQMQVPPEQGAFMRLLVELSCAKRIIEVGTYTGYSSIAMALALPSAENGGKLVACDSSEPSFEVARRYWKKAGVDGIVMEKLGDGKQSLQELIAEQKESHNGEPSYDLGFIDADKRGYWSYYDTMVTSLIKPGGIVAIDNVLWYGKVADTEITDKQTVAIREFNQKVFEDERVTHCTIPIGDGLTVVRVR
ncbi:class I SAM-dependent methyltransferase [bacterium]|nr:class I SAM-dependent methyltransferase [bacterium]